MTNGVDRTLELKQLFGFSEKLPDFALVLFLFLMVTVLVIYPTAYLTGHLKRKFYADIQARVGPNMAGIKGILQPLADLLKLLQKLPPAKEGASDRVWAVLLFSLLAGSICTLPLSSLLFLFDTEMSVFIPLVFGFLSSLSLMFWILYKGETQGWLGVFRSSAQTISGGFVALMALLSVGISCGGFKWSLVLASQGFFPTSWLLVAGPFPAMIVSFFAFYLGGLILFGAAPFDAVFSPLDIQGGVVSGSYGRRLSVLQFLRFYSSFFWAMTSVCLFMGGFKIPAFLSDMIGPGILLQLVELGALVLKSVILLFATFWITAAVPRPRADQVTDFCWKILGPCALLALLFQCLWSGGKFLF